MFWFKKSAPQYRTKVWRSNRECLTGINTDVTQSGETVIIVALFEDSVRKIAAFLESIGVAYERLDRFTGGNAITNNKRLYVIDAASGNIPAGLSSTSKVSVFFYGHYPYLPTEEKLVEQIKHAFSHSTITFYCSMDDAIFETFGGNRLKSTMDTLGMKENESVEHQMITTAIRRAQEKISKDVIVEMKANSDKDWFLKNVIK